MLKTVDNLKNWFGGVMDDLESKSGEFKKYVVFLRATWVNIDGLVIYILCTMKMFNVAFILALAALVWGIREYMKENAAK